jgi:hypothetical protein
MGQDLPLVTQRDGLSLFGSKLRIDWLLLAQSGYMWNAPTAYDQND